MACGTPPPRLPSPLVRAEGADESPADARAGQRLFVDRELGRVGLACGDCHRGPGSPPDVLRPGPDLAWAGGPPGRMWSGATHDPATAVDLCVERYLARPPLAGQRNGHLVAALLTTRDVDVPSRASAGAALYDLACRRCHEDGPGPALVGRRWSPRFIADYVRGRGRPAHPGTLMPPWPTERLDDPALRRIAEWLTAAESGF